MGSKQCSRSKPLDLSHHFSRATRKRAPNVLKEYYKFLRNPDMCNFAGGLPFPKNFPFDAIELKTVLPGSLSSTKSQANGLGLEDKSTRLLRVPRTATSVNSIRKIDLDTALQYGSAQGYPPLHAWLKKLANSVYHPNLPYEGGADVLINGGSADGLAKVFELLFNHWDQATNSMVERESLLVEQFVYAPPIAQAAPRDINIVPVMMDAEGIVVDGAGGLLDVLKNWQTSKGKRPHVLYLIPTGQNPTSGVLSFMRRKAIYEICSRFDIVIIEDDPYWNLYYASANSNSMKYRGAPASTNFPADVHHNYCVQSLQGRSTGFRFLDELPPSFLSIDTDGRVIRLDSFSKTIAPGCRLGWVTAQPGICEQLFRITDGTSQQPSGLMQAIVVKLLGDLSFESSSNRAGEENDETSATWGLKGWVEWLEGLRSTNERRMTTMATILEEARFVANDEKKVEMFTFNWPMGGMFLWVRVQIHNHPLATSVEPKNLMIALWLFCTAHPYRILLVPGGDFAANDAIKNADGYQYLRFCFAAVEEDILATKTRAFVTACNDFWNISDSAKISGIIEGDTSTLSAEEADGADADREVIEDW